MKKHFVLISLLGASLLGVCQQKEEYVTPLSSWDIGISGGAVNGTNLFSKLSCTLVFENNWGFRWGLIHGSTHPLSVGAGETTTNHRLIALGPVRCVRLNDQTLELLIHTGAAIWRKTETWHSPFLSLSNQKSVTTIEYILPGLVSGVCLRYKPSRYFGIEIGPVAAINPKEVFLGIDLGICFGKLR